VDLLFTSSTLDRPELLLAMVVLDASYYVTLGKQVVLTKTKSKYTTKKLSK